MESEDEEDEHNCGVGGDNGDDNDGVMMFVCFVVIVSGCMIDLV